MNKIQKELNRFLKAAVEGEKLESTSLTSKELEKFYFEAEAHKVTALVYSAMGKTLINEVNEVQKGLWKDTAYKSTINQMRQIKQISFVLNELKKEGIESLCLKGLILRNLYPNPLLRTMSDSDILVHEKDLEVIKNILLGLGYVTDNKISDHDIVFNNSFHCLEVHFTLLKDNVIERNINLDDSAWKRGINFEMNKYIYRSLSWTDTLIYICIHMIGHLTNMGFGIRNLVDLALLVENKKEEISWKEVINTFKNAKLDKILKAIFISCNELFNMTIPGEIQSFIVKEDYKTAMDLIDSVYEAGLRGDRNVCLFRYHKLDKKDDKEEMEITSYSRRNGIIYNFFPPLEVMQETRLYLCKYKFLLPYAWVERIIKFIFGTKYKFMTKINVISKAKNKTKRRKRLMDILDYNGELE